jgi:hypothetical protein
MSDETAPQSQLKITWLVGTLAAFALFVAIAGYSSRMTWDYPDYYQQRADARKVNLATVQKAENGLLDPVDAQGHPTAEWVDQAKGVVRIPIEEAMLEEIDTLKARPAAMGAVIPPPTPAKPAPAAGAPASAAGLPTTGATNAAPAMPAAPSTNAAPTAAAGPAAATPAPAQPNPSNP